MEILEPGLAYGPIHCSTILTDVAADRLFVIPYQEVCTMAHHLFGVEQLESRRLLDGTASIDDHQVFRVAGTDSDDTITIALSADGTKVQASLGGTVIGEADKSA